MSGEGGVLCATAGESVSDTAAREARISFIGFLLLFLPVMLKAVRAREVA